MQGRRNGESSPRGIRIYAFEKRWFPKLVFTADGEHEDERDYLRPESVVRTLDPVAEPW